MLLSERCQELYGRGGKGVYAVFVSDERLVMIAAKSCKMFSFQPGEIFLCSLRLVVEGVRLVK